MREKEKTTRLIFIRHGKTDFPVDRIYCDDREDPELNAEGLEHARSAAEFLQDKIVHAIYASPSKRTRMTAQAIADMKGMQLQLVEALKERPFGIWDGLYFDQIAKEYPNEYRAWKEDPIGFVPEGGESIQQLAERVSKQIARLASRHTGQTVAVVSHVGPIRVGLSEAMGIPIALYRQLTIDYGSLSCVEFGHKQNNVIFLNISKNNRLAR